MLKFCELRYYFFEVSEKRIGWGVCSLAKGGPGSHGIDDVIERLGSGGGEDVDDSGFFGFFGVMTLVLFCWFGLVF